MDDKPSLIDRVLQRFGLLRAANLTGSPIYWPGSGGAGWGLGGWFGNGDRGPLGAWQMNRQDPYRGQELLAFSAVYACVNVIANDIAKLPVQVFELDLDTGARDPRRQDYYVSLMRAPNGYQTGPDFLQTFVQSYLLQGNT